MSWGIMRSALDLLLRSERTGLVVAYSGGEPLLEFPLIRRAVGYGERRRRSAQWIRHILYTNGMALSTEILDFLAGRHVDVRLSCDGVAEAQRYRGRDTGQVLDAKLDLWRRRHPDHFRRHLRVVMTVIPPAIPHLADSVDYLLAKGVQQIAMAPVITPIPGWDAEQHAELNRQFDRIVARSERHLQRTGEIPLLFLRRDGKSQAKPRQRVPMCGALNKEGLAVDPDGQVYACGSLAGSTQQFESEVLRACQARLSFGDVRSADFAKRYARFPSHDQFPSLFTHKERKYSADAKCRDCPHLHTCKVCPLAIGYQATFPGAHRVPDYICAFNRAALDRRHRLPQVSDQWRLLRNPEALYEQMQPWLEWARSLRKRQKESGVRVS
jgi:radical SAM protein with 4Fe4S-binding SPASM domain